MDREYFIKTKRLSFSVWRLTDIQLAISLWGNPTVTQFISVDGMTEEKIEKRLDFEVSHADEYGVQYWPVFLLETGEFIGCCGLRAFDTVPGDLEEGVYELGFHLKQNFWNKGYAKEAAEAVILYGFEVLQLKAIFAGHHPNNTSSAKLLNKLGFSYTGDRYYPPTGLNHPSYLLMNKFIQITPQENLSAIVHVLNISHATVAKDFGFTKEANPTNNAFIDEQTLRDQLNNGIQLYAISDDDKLIGCIAFEKSSKEIDTFYIEKVSVMPEFRNHEYGVELMNFATSKIKVLGAKAISISLIDSNVKLKKWYSAQGFAESGFKDFEHLPFRVCFMRKEIR